MSRETIVTTQPSRIHQEDERDRVFIPPVETDEQRRLNPDRNPFMRAPIDWHAYRNRRDRY